MGKSPGFWFFTGDWLKDSELRFCSIFARGLLVDLLCIMFEAKEQGYMSKPDGTPRSDSDIVDAISGSTREEKLQALKELEVSGVLSRDDRNVLYSRRLSKLKELSELRSKSGSKGGSKTQAKLKQTEKQNTEQNTEQKAGVTVTDSDTLVSERALSVMFPEAPLGAGRKATLSQMETPLTAHLARPKKQKVEIEKPDDVEEQAWCDWLAARKAKNLGPVTSSVLKRVKSEAEKLEWSVGQAIEYAASKSQGGFEADWVNGNASSGRTKNGYHLTEAQKRLENSDRAGDEWVAKMQTSSLLNFAQDITQ